MGLGIERARRGPQGRRKGPAGCWIFFLHNKPLLSFQKNGDKETFYLAFGLSAIKANACIACRHCYSLEGLFRHKHCENIFVQPYGRSLHE